MKKIVNWVMALFGIMTTMSLQLFADVQTTLMEGLSAEMKTFYDMTLIDEAQANLVHDQFGQKRPIPKNGGKTITLEESIIKGGSQQAQIDTIDRIWHISR